MTRERDVDELIHAFMQEGPAELSSRLLGGIRDDIHGTKQRTLRRPWRTFSMPRPILIFAALGALLVAVAAMSIVGFGGRSQPTVPAVSPSLAPTASPTPVPTPAAVAYPLADGEAWIALPADDGGVILIRPDGTGRHEILSELDDNVFNMAWSPDGHQLALEANGDRGSQLWVANADGTNPTQVIPTPVGCPDGTCTEALHPAWSRDGGSIAYVAVTHDGGAFTKAAIAILDLATATTTELVTATDASFARPSWSPDSKRLVYEVDRFEGRPEATALASTVLAVVQVDGTDHTPTEITTADVLAGYPTWHPSEDLIVFRTNRYDGNTKTMQDDAAPSDLYTVRPDGTRLTRVTQNKAGGSIVRAPSWTPDGRILFSRLGDVQAPELLHVMESTGAGEASATAGVETLGEGRWRPGT
jgi:dipeptidyl aminopeptidase/acylaminoacyl peptidase